MTTEPDSIEAAARKYADEWEVTIHLRIAIAQAFAAGVAAGIAAERARIAKEQADADEFNDNERRRLNVIVYHKMMSDEYVGNASDGD